MTPSPTPTDLVHRVDILHHQVWMLMIVVLISVIILMAVVLASHSHGPDGRVR